MPNDVDELIRQSKSGDRSALQELLVLQYKPLKEHVVPRIPAAIQSEIGADDLIQQVFIQVIRDIEDCRASNERSFSAWVRAIAEHRLQDCIRYVGAKKRGGGRARACPDPLPHDSAMLDLVEMLSAGSHRPSRSAIRHEAIEAVRLAIESLSEKPRRAVRLRLLEGKSLSETATAMNCSPRAVQGLVDRAKKTLRETLGTLSNYE